VPLDRRTFVKGALGASGALLLGEVVANGAGASEGAARAANAALPPPTKSGIEHVVVVMMENRSFDHFLGWLPHADGRQAGLAYPDAQGTSHRTFHQTQFSGCGFTDPDHSYEGGRLQYNNGKMNGFLTDTQNDSFAISYYEAKDRPFMSRLAQAYTTCDRYFCSILGPTYPNRFFQHAAQTDRLDDALTVSELPAIWDQLNHSGGPTGRYYYSDFPFTALWGTKYLAISHSFSQFLSDAAAGTLPNVSYVDPRFLTNSDGTSGDDHPLADIRAGDAFLSQVFHAVTKGPGWDKSVLVVNYDEWGGFFDHVAPHRITAGVAAGANPATGLDTDVDAEGKVLTGFRVPAIVASPFSRIGGKQAAVNHNFYDHTSVLKLIEWRWSLQPLTARDASQAPTDPGNLATLLNFSHPVTKVPKLPLLATFTPTPCGSTTTTTASASASASAATEASTTAAAAATGAPGRAVADLPGGTHAGSAPGSTWNAAAQSPLMAGWT
jgi:phospholipase C